MSGKFTLNILGSASAKPNLKRASSAQLLQAGGRLFLFDCSEGTQCRILRQNEMMKQWQADNKVQGLRRISKSRLDCIFISHIHGDHVMGLFPLLCTMSLNGRTQPLKIFGPNSLGPILTFYKSYWGDKDSFDLEFTALKMKAPELIFDDAEVQVEAFPLNHGIDTFGYLVREKESACIGRSGRFRPRSYAYCSDTAAFPELPLWVRGVDVLYHEATYMNVDKNKAAARFHSTTVDAATCARDSGAGKLLAGHYSSSIREEMVHTVYESELRSVFENSVAVDDGDIFDIPQVFL